VKIHNTYVHREREVPLLIISSREYNQQDATFLKFIYFCETFYMFQMVFLSIIRSTELHIQHQAFVRPLLLPAASLSET